MPVPYCEVNMPLVGSLVERVKTLLGVPSTDDFFQNADIIDWLDEGAKELFPWIKEEVLTSSHLKYEIYTQSPATGNRWYSPVPNLFMRTKAIEIEQVQNSDNWYYTQYGDYNDFSASISKINVLSLQNPSDYRSAKLGSYIYVFPLPTGRVRLNYFAYPEKRANEILEADYPEIIISAIIDFAVSRGKSKQVNGLNESIAAMNRFKDFRDSLQRAFLEVPPRTGITPEDKARAGL